MGTTSSVRSESGPKPGTKQKPRKHSLYKDTMDKGTAETGTSDKGTADKGTADKGTADKGTTSDKDTEQDNKREATKDSIQDLVKSNPHLEEYFQHVDEFIKAVSTDPKLDTLDYNYHSLSKLGFEDESDSDRRKLGDYMALVGAAEAINIAYGNALASLGENCIASVNQDMEDDYSINIKLQLLRDIVWNNTDASLLLGERVCDTGMLKYFVQDLKTLKAELVGDRIDMDQLDTHMSMDIDFEAAISILQNCSRNHVTRQSLRELDTVQQLLPYLKIDSEEGKLQTLFTLANLVDETENSLLLVDDSGVFDILFRILNRALKDDEHRYCGFSVEELLHGMTGLAKNDTNKEVLVQKGAIPILINVLKEGKDEEKEHAVKCIWELAFQKDNKNEFCKNEELLQLLKDMRTCPHDNTAKAAERALWVIKMDQMVSTASQDVAKPVAGMLAQPVKHVMISYQWADQTLIIRIRDTIRRHGYKVWMDIDNMEGSTLQAMAEAVQNSVVVLVCMSERYKQSQNCRSEAEYAFSLQRKIVPLLMERGYKPDGWLGIIKGTKLFFDFSGKYSFEQKISDLQRELGDQGRNVQEISDDLDGNGPIVAAVPKPVLAAKGPDLSTWSGKDVQNWLTKNGINGHASLKRLNGDNLVFLRDLSRRAPEFYFGFLKDDLDMKSIDDLMKFSRAVDKL